MYSKYNKQKYLYEYKPLKYEVPDSRTLQYFPLHDLNNFNFALNRKTCLFWCYALNNRHEEFFLSSFFMYKDSNPT